jgi:hypothetical protein
MAGEKQFEGRENQDRGQQRPPQLAALAGLVDGGGDGGRIRLNSPQADGLLELPPMIFIEWSQV